MKNKGVMSVVSVLMVMAVTIACVAGADDPVANCQRQCNHEELSETMLPTATTTAGKGRK
ncbi:UNVERIFIED_CONTAM: hypothetical protein Sindi_0456200 [Sesamum indicum]